jgi:hypothetical protein
MCSRGFFKLNALRHIEMNLIKFVSIKYLDTNNISINPLTR